MTNTDTIQRDIQSQALRDFRYWRSQCINLDDIAFYDREIARLQKELPPHRRTNPMATRRVATGYKGINFVGDGRKRPYLAYVHEYQAGRRHRVVVGYYETAEQAARAHDDAVRERGLHGQPVNFEVKDEQNSR